MTRRSPVLRQRLALLVMLATIVVLAVQPRRALAAPGDITTVAGTGSLFQSTGGQGDGGPATKANLFSPYGVAVSSGRYYFSQHGYSDDTERVRAVQNGTITTLAGGADPPLDDGAPATQAAFAGVADAISDAAGNLYIADGGHNRVRMVDATSGIVTTIAGASVCPTLNTCTLGPSGDGGPATEALIDSPNGLALDGAGNLYVSNFGDFGPNGSDNRIRKIDRATGIITSVAFGGTPADGLGDGGPATGAQITPAALAIDAAGDIYISDVSNERVRRVDAATGTITTVAGTGTRGHGGDGGPATAAQLDYPGMLSFDRAGNLYIADSSCRIRKIDAAGIISTFAGTDPGFSNSCGLASGDGGPATSAGLDYPGAPSFDSAGNAYFGEYTRVRKVDTNGIISTVVGTGVYGASGDGGPATKAETGGYLTEIDPAGRLILGEINNRVRAVDTSGIITTIAGGGVGDGFPATSATLSSPRGLATDASGDLYVADCGDNRVRKVDTSGVITSVAGTAASHGVGDGGPATSAGLVCPTGLAVAGGNLYIADSVDNRVRRVDGSGLITTVAGTGTAGFSGDGGAATAAQLNAPSGLAVDVAGSLYIADHDNNRVRRVDTAGRITTIAGNGASGYGLDGIPATSAAITWPAGLALGPNGSLTIAESGFARVRSVDAKGMISTIAGNGIPGYLGDGGPGTLATLDGPTGIAYDAAGNLLVADNQNLTIRAVAAGTPPPPPPVTKKTANCGMTITQNLTLADDIGPCPGDGVIIGGDGVHLDLNGHTISGNFSQEGNHTGVRATGRQKLKISNGTVTGFDAGVALIGGSGNTVTGITAVHNLGNRKPLTSNFGDGILMFSSSKNIVAGNTVADNGPFDGIGMIGFGADDNLVQNNVVKDTDNFGHPFNPGLGLGIITNPFLGFDRPRTVSLYRNQVVGNTVVGNGTAGISMVANVGGVVRANLSERNGLESPFGGAAFPGNGIGVSNLLLSDMNTDMLVENNQSYGNGRDGIQVGSFGNTITNNIANGNGGDQANLYSFDLENRTFDPTTGQPQPTCPTNTWSGNVWGSGGHNPVCTTAGGHALPDGAAPNPMPLPSPIPQGLGDPPPRQAP